MAIDDDAIRALRESNATYSIGLEDGSYCMIGGGYALDGSSLDAVRSYDWVFNKLKKIEKMIVKNMGSLKRNILVRSDEIGDKGEFFIVLDELNDFRNIRLKVSNMDVYMKVDVENLGIRICTGQELLRGMIVLPMLGRIQQISK